MKMEKGLRNKDAAASVEKGKPTFLLGEIQDSFGVMILETVADYPYVFSDLKFFPKGASKEQLSVKDLENALRKEYPDLVVTDARAVVGVAKFECPGRFLLVIDDVGRKERPENARGLLFLKRVDAFAERLDTVLEPFASQSRTGTGVIHYFYDDGGKMKKSRFYKQSSDFAYVDRALYPGIDVETLFEHFASSTSNLLFLTGEPGIGKTTLVKYFIRRFAEETGNDKSSDYEYGYGDGANVAYCKDEKVVGNDAFWVELSNGKYRLLVLDDFDGSLSPRAKKGKSEEGFVSKLLSFSDGVFDNSVKVVITTNRELDEIDPALLRPGRAFDILKLRKLTATEAKNVWTGQMGLDEASFESAFGDGGDGVPQGQLLSEAKRVSEKKEKRAYLKEDGISVMGDFANRKSKIGFGD